MAVRKQKRTERPVGFEPFTEGQPVPPLPRISPSSQLTSSRAKKTLAPTGATALYIDPYADHMETRDAFLKVLDKHAGHLSKSRRIELAERFADACNPLKPMKWKNKPHAESFETFFRREYRDRGLTGANGITAADIARYDDDLAVAYRTAYTKGRVPDDCMLAVGGPRLLEPGSTRARLVQKHLTR